MTDIFESVQRENVGHIKIASHPCPCGRNRYYRTAPVLSILYYCILYYIIYINWFHVVFFNSSGAHRPRPPSTLVPSSSPASTRREGLRGPNHLRRRKHRRQAGHLGHPGGTPLQADPLQTELGSMRPLQDLSMRSNTDVIKEGPSLLGQ